MINFTFRKVGEFIIVTKNSITDNNYFVPTMRNTMLQTIAYRQGFHQSLELYFFTFEYILSLQSIGSNIFKSEKYNFRDQKIEDYDKGAWKENLIRETLKLGAQLVLSLVGNRLYVINLLFNMADTFL